MQQSIHLPGVFGLIHGAAFSAADIDLAQAAWGLLFGLVPWAAVGMAPGMLPLMHPASGTATGFLMPHLVVGMIVGALYGAWAG